jgi:hypothetical protein
MDPGRLQDHYGFCWWNFHGLADSVVYYLVAHSTAPTVPTLVSISADCVTISFGGSVGGGINLDFNRVIASWS